MRFILILLSILLLSSSRVETVDAQEQEKQCTEENAGEGSCSSSISDGGSGGGVDGGDVENDDDSRLQQELMQHQPDERPPDVMNPPAPVSPPRDELLQQQCGLYMAESSIPHAGWGMFTGKKLTRGRVIEPLDVVIDAYDVTVHHRFFNHNEHEDDEDGAGATAGRKRKRKNRRHVPQWLMDQYHWNPEITKSQFSADVINSIMVRNALSFCINTPRVLHISLNLLLLCTLIAGFRNVGEFTHGTCQY
jgi:hypothetical protein